jgi:tetratricopeptide (TPR) repeat protein
MACYREATRLDPNCAPAYGNLGSLLFERGDLAGALVQFEAAARIAPTANNHYAVANTLWEKGDWALAAAAYRRVLERKPDHAEALCNLGGCLVRLGRFTEALEPLRKGDELGRQQPGWSHPSEQWVKDAESLAALDLRLAPVLSGGAAPPAELLDLAQQCQRRMRRYADATLLYARAFAAEPSRARELGSHRYNAACSAALAGCGREVASADRARLRAMALDWLQAELAAYGENAAVEQLKHWLVDPDLSGVRDAPELAQLPDDERERWTRLWNDVRDRVATAAKN